MNSFRCHRRGAFTLIEMIVVMVILAVLAGMVVPRMVGNPARKADLEAVAVQRLLTAAAEKTSLVGASGGGVAIDFESGTARLSLLVRRQEAAKPTTNAAAGNDDWIPDPLVLPVDLEHLELRQAAADGQVLDVRRWRIHVAVGDSRPEIALLLAQREGSPGRCWELLLPREAAAAQRLAAAAGARTLSAMPGRSIDLDAAGKGEQAW